VNPVTDPATLVLHELRGPLGLMATAAQSAADDCADDDIRSRCEMIVRAAERMLRTANEVFQLSRAAQADECHSYSPFEVADEMVQTLRGLAVGIRLEATPDVRSLHTQGVSERFEALLHSLISNGVDHCEPGSAVRVSLTSDSGTLRVAVENEASLRPRHRGLGLGTHVADSLAERLGGAVVRECEGGRFRATLTLPLA
jgi:two-component system, OmpR family, heavy metal sensor histidine kinase CusS